MKPSAVIHRLQEVWKKPTFVMMVGVPGSGKSTFLKKFMEITFDDIHVASTDDLIEVYAAEHGIANVSQNIYFPLAALPTSAYIVLRRFTTEKKFFRT